MSTPIPFPTTLALGLLGLAAWVVSRIFYNVFLHPLREYPGPFLSKFCSISRDYHLFRGTSQSTRRRLHQQYGLIVRISPDDLSYAGSDVWKDVWAARNPEFSKDPRMTQMAPNGAYNILNAPKDDHARFRRLLSHAFSEKGLQDQEPRIKKYVDLLIQRLGEEAQNGRDVDIVDWYTRCAFDVIGDLAWGESFRGLEDRYTHEWIMAILAGTKYVFQGSMLTRWHLGWLKPYLLDQTMLKLRARNFALAAEKSGRRAALGSESRGDFWDRVLIKSAGNNETGQGMTLDEMSNNTATLVLAGAETSATALSATTYLLTKHPQVLKRVNEEIRAAFKSSDDIDVLSVNRLTYMLAVLTESMRIYPPVPEPGPRVTPPGGGMVCGQWVPGNMTIRANQLAASHLEANFHRPNDFVPERWLAEAPSEFAHDNKMANQPFAVGNRNCIGKNLAYAEMRLILAKVLFHYDLKSDEKRNPADWFDQKAWGVWVKNPLYVRLTPAVR